MSQVPQNPVQTEEPTQSIPDPRTRPRYVMHKHQARQLHYDLRLELDGVLKSWTVPKGPALAPGGTRLAIMVEDHLLEYGTFEGVISEGTYGAGTVMVWDAGTYRVPGAVDLADEEQMARVGLAHGHMRVVLEGERLRGTFDLIRLVRRKDNAWLLVTGHDIAITHVSAAGQDRSVLSHRTMEEITERG
jgi:bifunctional non-homologous end joining protein LigD